MLKDKIAVVSGSKIQFKGSQSMNSVVDQVLETNIRNYTSTDQDGTPMRIISSSFSPNEKWMVDFESL